MDNELEKDKENNDGVNEPENSGSEPEDKEKTDDKSNENDVLINTIKELKEEMKKMQEEHKKEIQDIVTKFAKGEQPKLSKEEQMVKDCIANVEKYQWR